MREEGARLACRAIPPWNKCRGLSRRTMKKFLIAGILSVGCSLANAQQFPGEIIAAYYMQTMSTPKGWNLEYKGKENNVQVFTMTRDLDSFPQTAMLQPIDQMKRLMCGDDTLKKMVNGGVKVRVDSRDKQDGKYKVTKGPVLSSC